MTRRFLSKMWPIIVYFIIIVPLNVDFSVIPTLKFKYGLDSIQLIIIASVMGNLELLYSFWFFRRMLRPYIKKDSVRETIEFGKDIAEDLRDEGYIDKIKLFIEQKLSNRVKSNKYKAFVTLGYVGLFCFAAFEPLPSGRTIGILVCSVTNWWKGFFCVASGNVVHFVLLVLLLNLAPWLLVVIFIAWFLIFSSMAYRLLS